MVLLPSSLDWLVSCLLRIFSSRVKRIEVYYPLLDNSNQCLHVSMPVCVMLIDVSFIAFQATVVLFGG